MFGAGLAFRLTPAGLLRLVPASQGVLAIYFALAATAAHRAPSAVLFMLSGVLLFLANARVWSRGLIPLGAGLFLAAIGGIAVGSAADPTFVAAMALPPLCLIGMGRLHEWSWRERKADRHGT